MLIEVFRELLKCLKVPKSKYEDSSEGELKEKVRKCLSGKKYLVVLDDLWDTNNPWDALRGCFPRNNNGSIILTTSRDDRVANVLESKNPHLTVSLMNEEESWQLFHNEVFYSKTCPPELEPIGRSIAESCNGLPLVIKTTAGIVAKRERSEEAWEEIKNLLPYWSIAEDKDGKQMMERLKLSYDDLSEQMKPCFLYLGAFLEDEEISVRDLICMWMAEDFIKPIVQTRISKVASAIEPEDIGEQYLKELVDRNLVQVASRRNDGKGVKTCKIHDSIRELCILVSNNLNDSDDAPRLSFPSYDVGSYACLVTYNQSSTCSLFVYGNFQRWSYSIPEDSQVKVLYVKALDLTSKKNADEYLKMLKSIRFLRTDFGDLHWLFKLQSLQTLNVLVCSSFEDKISIGEGLKQLRHLRSLDGVLLLVDEEVKDKMQNVQTLLYVYADSQMWFLFNNGCFANLRALGLVISDDEVQLVEENLRSLDRLSKLRRLKLDFETSERVVSLGKIAFPSNLSEITLHLFDGLKDEDMNALGRIPNLKLLKLVDVKCSKNILHCGIAGSFPLLQVFIVIRVKVAQVILEHGAMPKLRRAVFRECPRLGFKYLPEQMLYLGSNLHFVEPAKEEDDDDDEDDEEEEEEEDDEEEDKEEDDDDEDEEDDNDD